MNADTAQREQSLQPATWPAANAAYLKGQWQRLRLLLERRILWLRYQWNEQDRAVGNLQGPEAIIRDAAVDRLLVPEDARAEREFYDTDPRARGVCDALARLEVDLRACSERMAAVGQPAALDVLCRLFELDNFERDNLLLAAAPEFDASFARLYAYVQDDANLRQATPQLALALLCNGEVGRQAVKSCLLPGATLRGQRLVELDAASARSFPTRALQLDERVRNYLDGVNHLDKRVLDVLRPVAPLPLSRAHSVMVDQAANWLKTEDGKLHWQGALLCGAPGSAREAMAGGLAAQLKLHLYRLDVNRVPTGAELLDFVALLGREAILSHLALFLEVPEADSAPAGNTDTVRDLIERLPLFCLVAGRSMPAVERPLLVIPIPALDMEERRTMWRQALAASGYPATGRIDGIAEQFDFGPRRIMQTVQAAAQRVCSRRPENDDAPTAEDLWEAARAKTSWRSSELARPLQSAYTWDDIVLPEDVRRQLFEIAAQVIHRGLVYHEWDFGSKLLRGRGLSVLFSGVSGTGKTMAAEVLSRHLRLDLYRVDLAGVVNKYVGETEKNLRRIFDDAESAGAILFFDEADALFGRRTEIRDSHDRFANIEVNYLLQRMEDYRGLSILATNRKADLDRAFLRRLRFLVDFPFPDTDRRRRIWRKVFPPRTPLGELDYDLLARMEITGGSIRNVALAAAFLAAQSQTAVEMSHLLHAARREYAKIDKLMTDAEFPRAVEGIRRP